MVSVNKSSPKDCHIRSKFERYNIFFEVTQQTEKNVVTGFSSLSGDRSFNSMGVQTSGASNQFNETSNLA